MLFTAFAISVSDFTGGTGGAGATLPEQVSKVLNAAQQDACSVANGLPETVLPDVRIPNPAIYQYPHGMNMSYLKMEIVIATNGTLVAFGANTPYNQGFLFNQELISAIQVAIDQHLVYTPLVGAEIVNYELQHVLDFVNDSGQ